MKITKLSMGRAGSEVRGVIVYWHRNMVSVEWRVYFSDNESISDIVASGERIKHKAEQDKNLLESHRLEVILGTPTVRGGQHAAVYMYGRIDGGGADMDWSDIGDILDDNLGFEWSKSR